jgi:hypothetical protein
LSSVTYLDPEKDPRWDRFVESSPFGLIYHLSKWKRVLEKSFGHMRGFYLALIDEPSGQIKAGLPVFEVNSWLTGKRLVSVPFATRSDPLVANANEFNQLFEESLRLASKVKSKFIEIRTFSRGSVVSDDRLNRVDFYKHHYIPLNSSLEDLRKTFHSSCVDRRITKAQKSNLTLIVGRDESDLNRFFWLHSVTRKRQGLPLQPYDFFRSLWEELLPSKHLELLLATKDSIPLAGLILLKFKGRVSVEYAASDDAYHTLSPNHYIYWEAIRRAYEQGYETFDFGRTSPLNKGLMGFKNRWGTTMIDMPYFYYPEKVLPDLSGVENTWTHQLARKICLMAPLIFQRPIGSFCYRHLG